MDIKVRLDLNSEESNTLASIFNCSAKDLPGILGSVGSAALTEYATMFLGQKALRRGSDILEYRLFLLIKTAFQNLIPAEHTVCSLFKMTPSETRTLVRAVTAKYQFDLKAAVDSSMKAIVQDAEQMSEGGVYSVIIKNVNVVEELNELLSTIDGSLAPVTKQRGSISSYEMSPASYEALCKQLGVSKTQFKGK